ncbi:MAG: hypothetical protein QNK33_02970 [Bacteroidales bacterium]|nr:hypothetical protein [Bacteroidales bacterium]
MRKNQLSILLIFAALLISGLTNLYCQEKQASSDTLRKDAINIFIDCHRCDMNYIRKEIPYVNYVRDITEADFYILETSQETGSGGDQYSLIFQGQGKFTGKDDTLYYNSRPDDPQDLTREGRTKMIKMGLMRHVAQTPMFTQVDIEFNGEDDDDEVVDRWNHWVFDIEFDPNFEFEESQSEIVWENSILVSKITPKWKMEFEFDQEFSSTQIVDDGESETYYKRYWSQNNLIVGAISDHWSAGLMFKTSSSSYRNLELGFEFTPVIEYNIFPYSESTRRQLRIIYGIGYSFNDYLEETIYDKRIDHLGLHGLNIAYRVQQKWGSANLSFEASNYLHDFTKNRLRLNGSLRVRLMKGLSVQIRGSAALIHDQLALAKGDNSTEEILLRLSELQTEYSIDGGIGFVYTFGSIYNNVVNPRFGN